MWWIGGIASEQGDTSALKRTAELVEQRQIRPVVGRVESLDDLGSVRRGCEEVDSGKGGMGKFVVEIDGKGRM